MKENPSEIKNNIYTVPVLT